jgi:cell wall-associated NlpC family hydrolase
LPHAQIDATVASSQPVRIPGGGFFRRRVHVAWLAIVFAVVLVPVQPPATVDAATTQASRIVAHAKAHLGDRWVYGATGPSSFDCSGFVYHVFNETGLLSKIGGSRRTAAGYYWYFRSLGRANRYYPKVGDLVVYGYSGSVSHIGIYIGNGYTISVLSSGVAIHRTTAVTKPFIAYLHVSLTR